MVLRQGDGVAVIHSWRLSTLLNIFLSDDEMGNDWKAWWQERASNRGSLPRPDFYRFSVAICLFGNL